MHDPVKKYISEAFFILLERKEISKITINELIKKAGVCKASFYRNFDSYDGLIKEYLNSFFSSIDIDYVIDLFSLKEKIKETLLVFFATRKKFNILNKRNLLFYIYPYLIDKTKSFLKPLSKTSENNFSFISSGIAIIIYDWIKDNFKSNIDELTSTIITYAEKLKSQFF